MSTVGHVHDVLVIGAGASGTVAAATLAAGGHDVLLLEGRKAPGARQSADWLSPHTASVLDLAGIPGSEILSDPITHCVLYLADFSKSTTPTAPQPPAHLVSYHGMLEVMIGAYRAQESAHFVDGAEVTAVAPAEEKVSVLLHSGQRFEGKLLILATGRRTELAEQAGLVLRARPDQGLWCASYHLPAGNMARPGVMDYILGAGGGGGHGYRLSKDGFLTVGICVGGAGVQATEELLRLSQRLHEQGLLPSGWREPAEASVPYWSPAWLALELESHVSKRTLAVGELGGFVSTFTNEGIYPPMWSALIASQVASESLGSSQPQDKLREFENRWRMQMADHLRSPNADTQSLLPLVFSNKQMADKMLQSLLLGTNF